MRTSKNTLLCGLFLLILISLLISINTPVLADGETPPVEAPATELTPAPTDAVDVIGTVEPPLEATAEPEPMEVVTVEETAEATEAVTVEPTDTATPEVTLVEALSENSAVLADDQGNPIPLASEAASAVAQSADPYFMVGGIYYGYSTTGTCASVVSPANCTTFRTNPISDAITAYTTTYALTATGMIYIEAGSYTEPANIIISPGSNLTGLVGAGSTDSSGDPLTTLAFADGMGLRVDNTTLGFTLQGLTITGNINSSGGLALVDFYNNTGTLLLQDLVVSNSNSGGDGIEVTQQTGTVTLNRVNSSKNGESGAKITATGNVTVKNSSFDRNNGPDNLKVESTAGMITLNGVSAYENYQGNGASLRAPKGIKITDSHFENNYASGYGLMISSNTAGAIILDNVFANANYYTNIYLDGVNSPVTMSNIEADDSYTGYGVYIDNCKDSGGLCSLSVAGAITMTNINASSNYQSNIYIIGSGMVTATNITANYSDMYGNLIIDNHYAKTPMAVSVLGATLEYGHLTNLYILSQGAVTVNGIDAYHSYNSNGIYIDNTYGTGAVTFLNSLGVSDASYNVAGYGVRVFSKGNVTITGLTANHNLVMGADIRNYDGPGSVTITDATFDANGVSDNNGLYVQSKGVITLKNINANHNHGNGIALSNSSASTPKAVSVTTVWADFNDNAGIWIESKGNVLLSDFEVYGNNVIDVTNGGIYIYTLLGNGTVTLKNGETQYNDFGLKIQSNGNVILDTVSADLNLSSGAYIDNSGSSVPTVTVTIKKSIFSNDNEYGLHVLSRGLITLTSVRANTNTGSGAYGAYLENTYGAGGVTLTGTLTDDNEFQYNNHYGLLIETNGPVNLNFLNTYNNGGQGLSVTNNGAGTVTIANIISSENEAEGIYVIANGSITLTNPEVSGNYSTEGSVVLDNDTGSGGVTVQGSITHNGSITGNYSDSLGNQLTIRSHGAVTVQYLELTRASLDGLYIRNDGALASPVTITQVNSNYNHAHGLNILSFGVVTINGFSGYGNGANGIFVDNKGALPKNVSISKATTNSNVESGIKIRSQGAVTLAGIESQSSTTGDGIDVDNSYGTGGITLTFSGLVTNNIQSNPGYGVKFVSNGAIVINKLLAKGNTGTNITINNSTGTAPITINTLTATNSTSGFGIELTSSGVITLSGVQANGNFGDNMHILNDTGIGSVTITNGTFNSSSTGDGGFIRSKGLVTLTNIYAESNALGGFYVDNSGSTALIVPGVTVQVSGVYTNTINSNGGGLIIDSKGTVKLVNIYAHGNTGISVEVDNTGGVAGVTLMNIDADSNNYEGIKINTKGAVVGTNLTGSGGTGYMSILIDNCQDSGLVCAGVGSVTLTNVSTTLSSNGLKVLSNRAITINNLIARNIYNSNGAYLDNHLSSTAASVTINKATANENAGNGIYILSLGNVTLDGITAIGNYNSGSGVYVDNSGGAGNVSLLTSKGANTFNNNGASGFEVVSSGTILVTNVTANGNSVNGLKLATSGTGKAITITTAYLKNNYHEGIVADAQSACTFTGIKVLNNGVNVNDDGVLVNTNGHNLSIVNSIITGNGESGIDATVGGTTQTVTLSNTYFLGNDHYSSGSGEPNVNTDGKVVIL